LEYAKPIIGTNTIILLIYLVVMRLHIFISNTFSRDSSSIAIILSLVLRFLLVDTVAAAIIVTIETAAVVVVTIKTTAIVVVTIETASAIVVSPILCIVSVIAAILSVHVRPRILVVRVSAANVDCVSSLPVHTAN